MINANELRIGNWVRLNDELIQITWRDIRYTSEVGSSLEGIPLTPEVLEACGLPKNERGYFCFPGGRYVIVQMSNAFTLFVDLMETRPDVMEMLAGFKYLHQLQNLYFALTGQELNYQNP